MGPRSLHIAQAIASLSHHFVTWGHENSFHTEQRSSKWANLLCKLLRSERGRQKETLGENPGNEVARRSKILESSSSRFSAVTDGLKNLLRFCSLCQESGDVAKIKQATFYCTTALLSWSTEQSITVETASRERDNRDWRKFKVNTRHS